MYSALIQQFLQNAASQKQAERVANKQKNESDRKKQALKDKEFEEMHLKEEEELYLKYRNNITILNKKQMILEWRRKRLEISDVRNSYMKSITSCQNEYSIDNDELNLSEKKNALENAFTIEDENISNQASSYADPMKLSYTDLSTSSNHPITVSDNSLSPVTEFYSNHDIDDTNAISIIDQRGILAVEKQILQEDTSVQEMVASSSQHSILDENVPVLKTISTSANVAESDSKSNSIDGRSEAEDSVSTAINDTATSKFFTGEGFTEKILNWQCNRSSIGPKKSEFEKNLEEIIDLGENVASLEIFLTTTTFYHWKVQVEMINKMNSVKLFHDPNSPLDPRFHSSLIRRFLLFDDGVFVTSLKELFFSSGPLSFDLNRIEKLPALRAVGALNGVLTAFKISEYLTFRLDSKSNVEPIYQIPYPLNLIFDTSGYKAVFNVLFSLCRVDEAVSRIQLTECYSNILKEGLASSDSKLLIKFRQCASKVISNLMLFVKSSIDGFWKTFQSRLDSETDPESLKEGHDELLKKMLSLFLVDFFPFIDSAIKFASQCQNGGQLSVLYFQFEAVYMAFSEKIKITDSVLYRQIFE
jgi:hypothetical protein